MIAIDFSANWPLVLAVAVFGLLALLEGLVPTYAPDAPGQSVVSDARLFENFALGVLLMVCSALAPLVIHGASQAFTEREIGLFQAFPAHWVLQLGVALPAHSLAAYGLHRAFHRSPLLWRLHAVHHSDKHIDLSTGLRSHPLVLLFTLPVALAVNALLGVSPTVAVAVATTAFVASFWQHAAIALPPRLERVLQAVLVTPLLHRVHHAPERAAHDTNYGDFLIVWDRLFGTFREAHDGPQPVGLPADSSRASGLWGLLLWPFRPALKNLP